MPAIGRMRNLTTVMGSFHGRVLVARLGAEGVLVQLKGASDGPYPLQGAVEVLVPAEQLELAREILLADAVDDAFDDSAAGQVAPSWPEPGDGPARRRPRVSGAPAALVVVVVITLIVVAFVAAAH